MRECENGMRNAKPSLAEFVDKIRSNRCRLELLRERLMWVEHLIYSVPGPVYGGSGGKPSNPYRNKLPELLDRKDEIGREIMAIEEEEALLHEFEGTLTARELDAFHLCFFKNKSQAEAGLIMGISQQAVSQHIAKIEEKWALM